MKIMVLGNQKVLAGIGKTTGQHQTLRMAMDLQSIRLSGVEASTT